MSNRSSAVETANHKRFDPPAIFAGYCDKKLPYFGHIALMSAFVVGFGAALARAASKRGRFNDPSWSDLFLLSIATHKISRIVTKDRVTSPVRAPFTRLTGESGSGEVEETARGQGLQRAVGE